MNSTTFFGSSKRADKATELKQEGNTHYKNGRFRSAVKLYTQALFFAPWPLPKVLSRIDDCIRGLEVQVRTILYEDLLKLRNVTEPHDSLPSLLAQCYGNRSAALYSMGEHESVVVDIELALAAGYKKPQVFKLYKRQTSSLVQLGRFRDAYKVVDQYREGISSEEKWVPPDDKQRCIKDLESILSDLKLAEKKKKSPEPAKPKENPVLSNKSELITLESTAKYGRHITANDEIPIGTCLVTETPHVYLLKREYMYTHCAVCFTESLTLIPCMFCVHLGYCSYECMYRSFCYHWLECKNANEWACLPWVAQMAMRMVLCTPRHVVQNLIKEGWKLNSIDTAIRKAKTGLMVTPEKDVSVLCLTAHRGRYSNEEQRILIEKEALSPLDGTNDDLSRFFDLEELQINTLYELFRYHMCQLRFNTVIILVNALETNDRIDWEGVAVRDVVPQKLGYGLYLISSQFNHSCDPNVFFRFENTCLKVLAHKGAENGDGLFHCYGPQIGRQKKADRIELLETAYMFTCTCKACHNPDSSLIYREYAWDAIACPHCKGLLPTPIVDYQSVCPVCKKECFIKTRMEQLDASRRVYKEGMTERRLHKLLQCEKVQREILFCNNLELAKTRDSIAYFQMIEGNPKRSFDSCMESYKTIKEIFGIGSIEATEELCKLTQVLFRSSNPSDALKTASNALPLLELFYGPDHVDVIQIRHMRDVVDSGKRL